MSERLQVLLVEDDVVSVMGIRRAFDKLGIANPLSIAKDGAEALALLRGDGREPLPRPFLILLDLNLPRMDGRTFLAELRRSPELRHSVVFVLTTSRDLADRSAAAEHGATAYLVKSDFIRDVEAIADCLVRERDGDRVFLKLPEGEDFSLSWNVSW
jgi:CheY-like chemotaxis protein